MPGDAPQIVNLAELDGPEYAALIEWRPISYDEGTETGCLPIVTERPHRDAG